MRLQRGRALLVSGVGLLLVLTGCSTPAGAGSSGIRVIMKEWSLTPSSASVRAGQVNLDVVNQGQAEHEVVVLKTDLATNALKIKANGAEVDESASGQIMGEIDDVGPGQTKSVTLNLAPGRYVLTCNILGHYRAGMVTVLAVN